MFRRSDIRSPQEFFIRKIKLCFAEDPEERLPGCLLALPPSFGKTALTLTAISELQDEGLLQKVLIVSTLNVSKTVWPFEHKKWEHLQHLDPVLLRVEEDDREFLDAMERLRGRIIERADYVFLKSQFLSHLVDMSFADLALWFTELVLGKSHASFVRARADALKLTVRDRLLARKAQSASKIHIINKEALPWLWSHWKNRGHWPYEMMVIDDCREARSGKMRVKSKDKSHREMSRFGVMAQARKYMKCSIILSGTPTPKGIENLWGLAFLIDGGKRLGPSMNAFRKKWFHLVNKATFQYAPKRGAFEEILSRIKDIMFSVNKDDMPELPAYEPIPRYVTLPEDVLKAYRKFDREYVSDEYGVEAVNAGVKHGKLMQFANGSMYNSAGEDVWVHDEKIKELKNLVEELDGTPLLVAYTYEFDVDRIMKAFPDAVKMTPKNAVNFVKDFNEDKIILGLAHRDSCAHGLDLQKGTGHMCQYGLTPDLEAYLQFLYRIRRSGRKIPVCDYIILAKGTIDEKIFPEYLEPKNQVQDEILSALEISLN